MTKYSNYKDFFLRTQLKKYQSDIFLLKSFLLKEEISKSLRFKIMLRIQLLHKGLIGNKIKNRCIFSTKIRAVSRLSNLTKSSFRETLRWGKMNGFKRATW